MSCVNYSLPISTLETSHLDIHGDGRPVSVTVTSECDVTWVEYHRGSALCLAPHPRNNLDLFELCVQVFLAVDVIVVKRYTRLKQSSTMHTSKTTLHTWINDARM